MTGTYPVQTYLQRIGVAQTPICLHCDERVPESLTHFACLCLKFREARTSAHNQVRDVITSFLTSTFRPEWTLFEETRMAKTGLILRSSFLTADDVDQLGRRQPDWILVSKEAKRIAIIDLCRPSDIHQTQLQAAAIRKQQAYQPLVEGLSYYTEQGWVVHAFPLIVGIRGMIDSSHVQSLLKFLDISECRPKRKWLNSTNNTTLWSPDNIDYQPTKRLRQGIDRGEDKADKLWTRLNKLNPRKQRSSYTRFGHNAITSNAKHSF
jgi:hypothetical protein